MKINSGLRTTVVALSIISLQTFAAEQQDRPDPAELRVAISMPKTSLAEILDNVSRKTGKRFLVDHKVPPEIVVGQIRPGDVDYSLLLTILRNNGIATATAGDVVNIVPTVIIRQYPLPVLFEDDATIDGEEWVTRVIQLKNAPAATFVPIMRPLLPQAGHMAAYPMSNTILIVDRYANVKRVTEMISRMDSLAPPQAND